MSRNSRRKRAGRPWQDATAQRDVADLLTEGLGDDRAELALDGYQVRRIDPERAAKSYLCPACGNAIPEGEGHVVVWPEHDAELRRHWHRHCWRIEVRRSRGAP